MRYLLTILLSVVCCSCQPYKKTGKEVIYCQSAEFVVGRAPFGVQVRFSNLVINRE